ncbi:MAG TPA: hypothetical protein VFX28_15615 [Methylomirabilota bacterium]|nr:hypothetical protein [Methylomirabilota bacterium]
MHAAGMRKGMALAVLWAEAPGAALGDVEAWAAATPPAAADPDAGVLSVARSAAVRGGPALVEGAELRDEAAAAAAGQAVVRAALERRGAAVEVGVYGQIFPPFDERLARHGPAPALQIGRIDVPPAHDEEFNEWYNTEYLVGYLKVPGVYSARRYRRRGAGPAYLTVYELADPGVSSRPDWDRARAQSVWRQRIERFWTHAPGSPGVYRRLAAGR